MAGVQGPSSYGYGYGYNYSPVGSQRGGADRVSSAGGHAAPETAAAPRKSFSIGEWSLRFLKGGIVDTVKSVFSPAGLATAGGLLAVSWLCPPLGAALTVGAIGFGVIFGGGKAIVNGTSSLLKAAEGDVEGSYQDAESAGNGTATALLSMFGARSWVRGGGQLTVNGKTTALDPKIANKDTTMWQSLRTMGREFWGGNTRYYTDGSGQVVNASNQNMSYTQILRNNVGTAYSSARTRLSELASASGNRKVCTLSNGQRVNTSEVAVIVDKEGRVLNAVHKPTGEGVLFPPGTQLTTERLAYLSENGYEVRTVAGMLSAPATPTGALVPTGTSTATNASGFKIPSFSEVRTGATARFNQAREWVDANPHQVAMGLGGASQVNQFGAPDPAAEAQQGGYGYGGQPTIVGYTPDGQPVWG
jgi:hypothetical protein